MKAQYSKLFLYFFVLGCTIFYSCNNSKVGTANKKNNEPEHEVFVTVTQTEAYCGGAQPTVEKRKEMKKKNIYKEAKIYVREGNVNNYKDNPIKIFSTDEKGEAKIRLPKGKYTFVFENKSNEDVFEQMVKDVEADENLKDLNLECLDRFFKKPDGILEIIEGDEYKLELNRHFKCSWDKIPCVRYTGNLPPSINR